MNNKLSNETVRARIKLHESLLHGTVVLIEKDETKMEERQEGLEVKYRQLEYGDLGMKDRFRISLDDNNIRVVTNGYLHGVDERAHYALVEPWKLHTLPHYQLVYPLDKDGNLIPVKRKVKRTKMLSMDNGQWIASNDGTTLYYKDGDDSSAIVMSLDSLTEWEPVIGERGDGYRLVDVDLHSKTVEFIYEDDE